MRITKTGDRFTYRGKTYTVGAGIYACDTDYKGLYGVLQEIRTEADSVHGEHPSLYCKIMPPINDAVRIRIEQRCAEISGGFRSIAQICSDEVIMRHTEIRPMKQCRIYQVQGEDCRFLFQPYDRVRKQGFTAPPREAYRIVYDGMLQTDDLEEIFYLLNCRQPKDFHGWSLTVSDIVELYTGSIHEFYYCDTAGWVKIPFGKAQP